MRSVRFIEVVRAAWGVALLTAPTYVLRVVTADDDPDHWATVVTRVLGARHLTQAALSGVRPSAEVLAMGVWTDAVHTVTALTLAGVDHGRMRMGLADAGIAGSWAFFGLRDLDRRPFPRHGRGLRDRLARTVLQHLPAGAMLLRRTRLRVVCP